MPCFYCLRIFFAGGIERSVTIEGLAQHFRCPVDDGPIRGALAGALERILWRECTINQSFQHLRTHNIGVI